MNYNKLKSICILYLISLFAFQIKAEIKVDSLFFNHREPLNILFEKLIALENTNQGKINIVHIGDSHIQADFFTDGIRKSLQDKFGNGGIGLVFPHRLIRTNGSRKVQYVSNANWEGHMCAKRAYDSNVGLSGFVLSTTSKDFILELNVVDEAYKFNTIKLIYPTSKPQFEISNSAQLLEVTKAIKPTTLGVKTHKIKNGESLSVIARKYKVTLSQLKKANNLKSDRINAGKSLKIPTKIPVETETKIKLSDDISFLPLDSSEYCSIYTCDTLMSRMVVFPQKEVNVPKYALNGIVLENNQSGIIYHTIGANGAGANDFSKYPLFFKQLPILKPDLVLLSFGTNESFGRMNASDFIDQLKNCISKIKEKTPNVTILAITPPPSMLRRRSQNVYVDKIARALTKMDDVLVWDLYTRMGGINSLNAKGKSLQYINRDRIHYTEAGYQVQATFFIQDFMGAYQEYKNSFNK